MTLPPQVRLPVGPGYPGFHSGVEVLDRLRGLGPGFAAACWPLSCLT